MNLDPAFEANDVLEKLWGNQGFPVDPVSIAQKMGLRVLDTELPPSVSGALIKEAGSDPTIALHHADHSNRKRFTCAHELGHYVSRIRSNKGGETYEYIDLRGPDASSGLDPEEVFANNFAANLLMPEDIVRERHKSDKSTFSLALFFGVSNESMNIRLQKLRLI